MPRKIRDSATMQPVIRDVSVALPRIEPDEVAAALGAEPCRERLHSRLGPISLLAVRQELLRRLRSTGGRPALAGATRRVKIPLRDQQWQQLEELAAEVLGDGSAPSAGQVAGVLLSLSLESIAATVIKKNHASTSNDDVFP
jgi:hypothetical protein